MMLARDLDSALGGPMGGISPDVYCQKDFEAISKIVYDISGIAMPKTKAMLVYSRLAPLVRATNSATFAAYVRLIRENAAECARAVESLTTNHTFFYRESHHFEHFAKSVRPALLEKLARREPVRMWSAGCSSGEEIWSLVLTLLGPDAHEGGRIAGGNLLVLATDLSSRVLATAQAATYRAEDFEAVPEPLRRAWTRPTTLQGVPALEVLPQARQFARFKLLNLQEKWPLSRPFDVIFCRNVMIYFDQPTKERLVSRLCSQLHPGGHLYIGHSERATGPAEAELTQVGPTIYRRKAA